MKKILAIIVGLVVIAGAAFAFSNPSFFAGMMQQVTKGGGLAGENVREARDTDSNLFVDQDLAATLGSEVKSVAYKKDTQIIEVELKLTVPKELKASAKRDPLLQTTVSFEYDGKIYEETVRYADADDDGNVTVSVGSDDLGLVDAGEYSVNVNVGTSDDNGQTVVVKVPSDGEEDFNIYSEMGIEYTEGDNKLYYDVCYVNGQAYVGETHSVAFLTDGVQEGNVGTFTIMEEGCDEGRNASFETLFGITENGEYKLQIMLDSKGEYPEDESDNILTATVEVTHFEEEMEEEEPEEESEKKDLNGPGTLETVEDEEDEDLNEAEAIEFGSDEEGEEEDENGLTATEIPGIEGADEEEMTEEEREAEDAAQEAADAADEVEDAEEIADLNGEDEAEAPDVSADDEDVEETADEEEEDEDDSDSELAAALEAATAAAEAAAEAAEAAAEAAEEAASDDSGDTYYYYESDDDDSAEVEDSSSVDDEESEEADSGESDDDEEEEVDYSNSDWPFPDVNPDSWEGEAYALLYEMGILKGDANGYGRPWSNINRAEAVGMVMRSLYDEGILEVMVFQKTFLDVPSDAWYYDHVHAALKLGVIGEAPLFRPADEMSRAEFVQLLTNAANELCTTCKADFVDVKLTDWYYRAVATALDAGIVSGFSDGSFQPMESINRAQAAAVVVKALNAGWVGR